MARPAQGKDQVKPDRPPEPASLPQPSVSPSESEQPPELQGRRVFWLLVIAVWVGAVLLLWGTEIVGLVYRIFSASPG